MNALGGRAVVSRNGLAERCDNTAEGFAGKALEGEGKNGHFTMCNHRESCTIGKGSTNGERGLWNHLNRSPECGVTTVRSISGRRGLSGERP